MKGSQNSITSHLVTNHFRSSSIIQLVGLGQLPRLPETAQIVITSGSVVVFYTNHNTTPTKILYYKSTSFYMFQLKIYKFIWQKKYIFLFLLAPIFECCRMLNGKQPTFTFYDTLLSTESESPSPWFHSKATCSFLNSGSWSWPMRVKHAILTE